MPNLQLLALNFSEPEAWQAFLHSILAIPGISKVCWAFSVEIRTNRLIQHASMMARRRNTTEPFNHNSAASERSGRDTTRGSALRRLGDRAGAPVRGWLESRIGLHAMQLINRAVYSHQRAK